MANCRSVEGDHMIHLFSVANELYINLKAFWETVQQNDKLPPQWNWMDILFYTTVNSRVFSYHYVVLSFLSATFYPREKICPPAGFSKTGHSRNNFIMTKPICVCIWLKMNNQVRVNSKVWFGSMKYVPVIPSVCDPSGSNRILFIHL